MKKKLKKAEIKRNANTKIKTKTKRKTVINTKAQISCK